MYLPYLDNKKLQSTFYANIMILVLEVNTKYTPVYFWHNMSFKLFMGKFSLYFCSLNRITIQLQYHLLLFSLFLFPLYIFQLRVDPKLWYKLL